MVMEIQPIGVQPMNDKDRRERNGWIALFLVIVALVLGILAK